MPVVDLPAPWRLVERAQSTRSVTATLTHDGGPEHVVLRLTRCLASPLRDAYPVSSHDVRVEIDAPGLAADPRTQLLRDAVVAVESGDPACRRLVTTVGVDDLAGIAIAEDAGFRYVVDIDLAGDELSVMVAEPDWVTRVDMDLERVPGS